MEHLESGRLGLAYHLEGEIADGDGLVNLDALDALGWVSYGLQASGPVGHYLTDLRAWLSKRNLWTRQATFPRDARRKGGQMTTEAQTAARRANNAKRRAAAREANLARGEAKARQVLAMVAAGLTHQEMADRLGIAPSSVRSVLARARERLGLPAPVPERASMPSPQQPHTTAGRLGLDEIADALSTESSNVVHLPRRLPPEDEAEVLALIREAI